MTVMAGKVQLIMLRLVNLPHQREHDQMYLACNDSHSLSLEQLQHMQGSERALAAAAIQVAAASARSRSGCDAAAPVRVSDSHGRRGTVDHAAYDEAAM